MQCASHYYVIHIRNIIILILHFKDTERELGKLFEVTELVYGRTRLQLWQSRFKARIPSSNYVVAQLEENKHNQDNKNNDCRAGDVRNIMT